MEKPVSDPTETHKVSAQPTILTVPGYFFAARVESMDTVFRREFLDLEVPPVPELTLEVCEVVGNPDADKLFAELGERAIIPVSQFREFLAHTDQDDLPLFFLKGKSGEVCAVMVNWHSRKEGWMVEAGGLSPGSPPVFTYDGQEVALPRR